MKFARIPHTSLPGATQLITDLLNNFERVEKFYPHRPGLDAVPETLGKIDYPAERRATVVEALREQNRSAGEATAKNLDLLAAPETVVVATGQQVGLFGGPIFSVFKALTAAKHAETLRQRGMPAVAVFWLATEDHDLAEVDHAWVFNAAGTPSLAAAKVQTDEDSPVGSVKLPAGATKALQEALAGMPHGADFIRRAEEHYKEGRTLGQAFRGLFEDLLQPYGLIFLDPMDSRLRSIASELIRKAVLQGDAVLNALNERGKELEQAGYHQQVTVGPASSLLFRFSEGRRSAIRRSGERYFVDGDALSAQELAAKLERDPEGFSPNALLRPVVQDYLLPTAAFIGGPAELAYLAQSAVLYESLLGRMPVVMPRAGFTVLDNNAGKLLERYRLSVPDCFAPREELRQQVANLLTPPELQKSFDEEGGVIREALRKIHHSLAAFDPSLGEAFATSQRKIDYQLSKMQAKTARESLRRDERCQLEADRLTHLIFPEKTLQERLYCVLPFLAKHGDALLPTIYEAIDVEHFDHQVLTI